MNQELIFKGSYGTFKSCKLWIYKDRIVYKIPLSGEQSIQINQIASIELGSFFSHPGVIVIETTGGQKYDIIISPNDQKQVRDIIYQVQRSNKEKNNIVPETISNKNKKCPFCAELILAEAKKCRYCGEFLDKNVSENNQQPPNVSPTINEQKPKDENLIFETSYNDNETKVYKDKTTYKPPFMDEQPMPIERISSIELGKPNINEVTVKLTNGQRCRLVIERQEQEKYRNAVYAQLAKIKKEKEEQSAILNKEKAAQQEINNKYINLGLAIAVIIFIAVLFKGLIGNIFLWLFFASIACLLIGIIKPTVFSRFLKTSDKKKIIKIFGAFIIILLLSYWLFTAKEIVILTLVWVGLFIVSLSKPALFSRFIKIDAQRGKLITTFSIYGIISLFIMTVWVSGQSSNATNKETIDQNNQTNQQSQTKETVAVESTASPQKQTKAINQPKAQDETKKAIFPVKELINKTPTEIETATGQKLQLWGKKPSGKLMEASIDIDNASIWTVYTLVEHPKVKYNGTILFQISFNNPLAETEAWNFVGFSLPDKNKTVINSTERKMWKNISDIKPFYIVDAWYSGNKIKSLKFYLLSEDEEDPLYN